MILQPRVTGYTKQPAIRSPRVLPARVSTISAQPIKTPTKAVKTPAKPVTKQPDLFSQGKSLISKVTKQPAVQKTAKDIYNGIATVASSVFKGKFGVTPQQFEKVGAKVGQVLKKTPDVNLGTKTKKVFKATDTEAQITDFISNFPSAIARSYGESIEKIYTPQGRDKIKKDAINLPNTISQVKTHIENKEWQKAMETALSNSAFTVALDVSDFVPIGAVVTKGAKATLRKIVGEGIQETGEKVVKEVAKNPEKLITKTKAVEPVAKPDVKVEKPVVKPKEISVPREQLPVGTGKEKLSRLEARVTKSLEKAPETVKADLGLAKYQQLSKKENIASAVKYVNEKPDEALAVLRGEKQAPEGLLDNAIYVAMERQAVEDVGLARKLASLRSTRLGQELSVLTEIDPDSPVKLMRDVVNIREEAFSKRYGSRPVKDVSEKVIGDIKKRVKAPDKYDWNNFINSLPTC